LDGDKLKYLGSATFLSTIKIDERNHQRLPPLEHLTSDQILAIRDVRLNFPYNFAQPPSPEIRWSLADLIDHARFPMARLDPCDKWDIQDFSMENFLRVLDPKRMSEPGYLAPTTVAKVIAYGLQIAESTTETMEVLAGLQTWTGEDILAQIRSLADAALIDNEFSPWRHFWIATQHPTIRWAINNAMMNRWGATGFPPAR
jgi:hypothetical protein